MNTERGRDRVCQNLFCRILLLYRRRIASPQNQHELPNLRTMQTQQQV